MSKITQMSFFCIQTEKLFLAVAGRDAISSTAQNKHFLANALSSHVVLHKNYLTENLFHVSGVKKIIDKFMISGKSFHMKKKSIISQMSPSLYHKNEPTSYTYCINKSEQLINNVE